MSTKKAMDMKLDALSLSTVVSALFFAQQGYAAMPLAGQKIQNIAYASFKVTDANGHQHLEQTASNPVNIIVDKVYNFDLLPDTLKVIEAGATVIWLNQIVNSSNTQAWFDFETTTQQKLSNIKIYIDANQDGVFDVSDVLVTNGMLLAPNETAYLWIVADTSIQAADNEVLDLPVKATLREEPTLSKHVLDQVRVYHPQLTILKEVDQVQLPVLGASQQLNYTLTVSNSTQQAVQAVEVEVDGQRQNLVIVEDYLPANTTFEALTVSALPNEATVLHKLGEGRYSTVFPQDKTQVHTAVVGFHHVFAAQQQRKIQLAVNTVPQLSYTTLVNEAYVLHQSGLNQKKVKSNRVETTLAGLPVIDSTSADFKSHLSTGSVNQPVYLKSNAALCNANRLQAEKVRIRVTSGLTGDVVYVDAIETGLNTGEFHFSLDTEENAQKNLSDAILQTVKRDDVEIKLMACVDDNGQVTQSITDNITSRILIDPYGMVFDAQTGLPVEGATVILVDENDQPVGPNVAFEVDRSTGQLRSIPAQQVTNAKGEFVYPLVEIGRYKLLVDTSTVPNKQYSFVSDQAIYPINSFNGKEIHSTWSYGGVFNLTASSPALNIDIPIDPALSGASRLVVEKVARDKSVELGDFTNYTITVTNQGNQTARGVTLEDTLPRGFSYVPNTMRVDGQSVQDPMGGKGPYLQLGFGDLAANHSAKIEYRVQVGPNALNGDGINRARAKDRSGVQSNEAQAKVEVKPGVFSSDAFVIGKVYTDCNRNGMQDEGELGVPGIRLYMEDGSYVITDREGKYDFYGVSPKTHVLKIDRTTLPTGAELILQANRHAGDPSSRFVDVKRGELHRADFAVADQAETCSAPLKAAVEQRRQTIEKNNANLEKAIHQQLSIDTPNYTLRSVRGGTTDGCIATDSDLACALNQDRAERRGPSTDMVIEPVKPPKLLNLEEVLQNTDNNQVEILNLRDGLVLPHAQSTVQVKGAAGAQLRLLVNGTEVTAQSIGKRSVLAEKSVQGLDYIAVGLKQGRNSIVLEQLDFVGNVRESQQIHVLVPGEAHQFKANKAQAVANGKDILWVRVQLLDKHGVKVATRTSVTLESDIGHIELPDLSPDESGLQTFIEGGELLVPILAPASPGRGTLKVRSGAIQHDVDIQFLADLRPLIAVGLLEGSLHFNQFDSKKLHAVNANDGFEDELKELADLGGDQSVHGRAAMFLKGKVKGDYLLTLAYDSDKTTKQRLFRDIQPDEYYPVYGDAAAKGFEAQSTGKLYVRLDKGQSYAMYGDYVTRTERDEGLVLGQYNRSLTGVKLGHEGDKLSAAGFLAETHSRQVVSESRALGISGPYSLGSIPNDLILENSEKVEIITRDRNNPGLILQRKVLTRFTDYDIDNVSNSIYLREAISSVDRDLNPNYIRVTVEAEDIGEEYRVGGASLSYQLSPKIKVGGSFVQSDDPLQEEQIMSVNSVMKLSERAKVVMEVAQAKNSQSDADQLVQIDSNGNAILDDTGYAGRIEFEYKHQNADVRVYHHEADESFQNDASIVNAGRKESGIKASAPIEHVGLARVEAIRTEDQNLNGVRTGLSASLERNFWKVLALEMGLRHYDESTSAATAATDHVGPYNGTTARAKLSSAMPWKNATAFVEYEQDVSDTDKHVVSVGGTAQLNANTELYARHELISAIDGLYSLNSTEETNSTVFGISSTYRKDSSVFSEYRVADGMSNREAEAALGLRNRWEVQPRVFVTGSLEHIEALSGNTANNNESTAASIGYEYLRAEDWKAMTRLEARWSTFSDTFNHTMGYAHKLTDTVTLLGKNTLHYVNNEEATRGDQLRNRAQLGWAWRDQTENTFDMLSKFEVYYEDNAVDLEKEFKKQSYVTSHHVNYHPERRLTLSGQYAAKYSVLDETEVRSSAVTQLTSGRVIYDLNERWDVGAHFGVMWANQGAGQRYMLGAEVGYLMATNLWVSVGYNFMGYQDDELANTSSDGEGAYLRFRFKFDEDLFGRRNSMINPSLEPVKGDH